MVEWGRRHSFVDRSAVTTGVSRKCSGTLKFTDLLSSINVSVPSDIQCDIPGKGV